MASSAWTWLKAHRWMYAGIATLLAVITVAADFELHVLIWPPVFGLLALLLLHEHQLREAREVDGDDPRGRLILGVMVMVLGGIGIWLGLQRDWLFLAGAATTATAGGLVYGECRDLARTTKFGWVGPALFAIALVLFFYAVTLTASTPFFVILGFGILLGEFGAELLSETSHRLVPKPPAGADDRLPLLSAVGAGIGIVLALIGYALLVATGTDPTFALMMLVGLAFLVIMASVASDSVLVVALIVVMLAVAIQPREVGHPAADATRSDSEYFAVFGDSYISGEGAAQFITGTNTETPSKDGSAVNGCRQATTAWPYVLATSELLRRDHVPSKVAFFGCSGATTENIALEPRRDRPTDRPSGPAELALFTQRGYEHLPKFVILSAGGNDAGFGELATSCIGPGDCTEIGEKFLTDPQRMRTDQPTTGAPGIGGPEALKWIRDDLRAAYTRLRSVIPESVPVVVAPYPKPFAEVAHCRASLFSRDERLFIDGFATALDQIVTEEATAQHFFVIDTLRDALVDNDLALCNDGSRDPGLNLVAANPKGGDIRTRLNPLNWTHNSLHPNEDGHQVLAEVASKWFASHAVALDRWRSDRTPPAPDGTSGEAGAPDLSLARMLGGHTVVQCGRGPDCEIPHHGWVLAQTHALYSRAIAPLTVATLGLWLLVLPGTWVARRRRWSLATFTHHLWKRTTWLRTPPWWRRAAVLLAVLVATAAVLQVVSSVVGLPQGYGAAQSRSATYLALHNDQWRAWIEGTTRDLALYIPIYLILAFLVTMATSRWQPKPPAPPESPSPRWAYRFDFKTAWPTTTSMRAIWSDGVAVTLIGLLGVADYVETALFRHTLTQFQQGASATSLSNWTAVTAGFTAAKVVLAVLLVLVIVVRTMLPPVSTTAKQ